MKIKQYFDLNILKHISRDAKIIQNLCDEDNGFIFKRFHDSNILPDKDVVKNVNSYAAIIFLYNNYKLTQEECLKYSSLFKDDSPIMKATHKKAIFSKEAFLDIIFDEKKAFIIPNFLLNKDVKDISLSVFSKHINLYDYSAYYLFNEKAHLDNYEKNSTTSNCNFKTFLEYIKRVDDISFLSHLKIEDQTESNLKEIYFIFKKRDNNFTINEIFPYVCKEAKLKIIQDDYIGDFNNQILIDRNLNKERKLNEIIKSNTAFKQLNNIDQDKIINELTEREDVFTDYIISQISKKNIEKDFNFNLIPEDIFKSLFYNKNLLNNIQDINMKENVLLSFVENLDKNKFYYIFDLIDFNTQIDNREKLLKDYIIKKHSNKLLYNSSELARIWAYNIEDLYKMFQCLHDNNWSFKRDTNTEFTDYVEEAITNSSSDMFWKVLERAKNESPAVYTMLCNPLAIFNKIDNSKNFLSEEFLLFKEDYFIQNPDKQFKEDSSGKYVEVNINSYFYIYDFIDLNIVAKGMNDIRESLSKGDLNDSDRSLFNDKFNRNTFIHLNYMYDYSLDNKESLYLKPEN